MQTDNNFFVETLKELDTFNSLCKNLKDSKNNTSVAQKATFCTGVIDSQKCHLLYGVSKTLNRPNFIIAPSELKAKEIYDDMKFLLSIDERGIEREEKDENEINKHKSEKILLYPSKDMVFFNADVRSMNIFRERSKVFKALIDGENPTIVVSIEALFDKLTPKNIFETFIEKFKVGQVVSLDDLSKRLILMGYERRDMVEAVGQFAIRGGILDIFTTVSENAIRIELWDDEIDSIRILDSLSQRSIEKIEEIEIYPIRELVYEESQIENAIKNIKAEFEKTKKSLQKNNLHEELEILKETIEMTIEKFKNSKSFSGVDKYTQFFYDNHKSESLVDYLTNDYIISFDEPNRIKSHGENVYNEYLDSVKSRIEKGYLLPSQAFLIFNYDDILQKARKYNNVVMSMLKTTQREFTFSDIFSFEIKSSAIIQKKIELLIDELKYYIKKEYKILILAGAKTRAERLTNEILEHGVSARYTDDLSMELFKKQTVTVSSGSLLKGFEYPLIQTVIISDKDIFGAEKERKKPKKKKKGLKIDSFADLKIGDYVVHDSHGVGVFKGIEKISDDGISKDYLKVGYKDGGNLYIHTSQLDMLQKYIGGGDESKPKLNKLGGQEWSKARTKAKASIAILAKELVELYAKREATKGYTYSDDTTWQNEFEDQFPFDETEDQLTAIEDVKRDMQSHRVMDRLVCGDVGYGKTEIAIRAGFKAVQDNKQVAYLVPTTILAQQHYNTFVQRMKDYPINIGILSSSRTPKQIKETVAKIKSGEIDIVVGTHRLLSKDIIFNDLGLVIVDEEQRFGVTHKEKLKTMQENVDVLTLTATPIPRTLHMSMTGIRDMSVLEEPPQERKPINTYVMEYDLESIRDAINREIVRDGQVYFLHNRVKNIEEVASKIQSLVPEAVVGFAHGQMSERELENIMFDFVEGEIDVLVCTTIIETGLDIPNVNTIIIQDADHMGLSQLYQLRGRVGRSSRSSYAYLMYKRDKVLNEISEKRLQTIRDFTEFGSGFKVAMRDLEIRGAGNILGGEQHGHMEAIGYEAYCKLLQEGIDRLQGIIPLEAFETSIDVNVNAYIPGYYIENEEQKLEIYKKISYIQNQEDFFNMQEEIEDRFGNLPEPVQKLLDVALLKAFAHSIGVISIAQKRTNLTITFKKDSNVSLQSIESLLNKNKGKITFTVAETPFLTMFVEKSNLNFVNEIYKMLTELTI